MANFKPTQRLAWKLYLSTTWRLIETIDHELKKFCSVSFADYSVLLELAKAGEHGLRPRELAQRVVFSPSRLTHSLSRIEKRGFISRIKCLHDGRGYFITLTPRGVDLCDTTKDKYEEMIQRMAGDLHDEDLDTLNSIFTGIEQKLDDEQRCNEQKCSEQKCDHPQGQYIGD